MKEPAKPQSQINSKKKNLKKDKPNQSEHQSASIDDIFRSAKHKKQIQKEEVNPQ